MTDEELFKAGGAPAPSPDAPIDDHGPLVQETDDQKVMKEALDGLHKPTEPRTSVPPIKPPGIPGQPPEPQERHTVPLAELLDERDKRQRMERELQAIRQQKEQPKAPSYDPEALFADPQGFMSHMQQQFEQRVAMAELNTDLRLTAAQHGDEWQEAWNTYIQHVSQVDEQGRGKHPLDYYRIVNAVSPGQEIMAWHRERKWRDEVGDNPETYQAKLLDNPEFLARVAERLGIAVPDGPAARDLPPRDVNGQFRSAPPAKPTRLPTSLSKAPGASSAHGEDAVDGSEGAIWKAGGRRSKH
jgi:hypothetical protein